MPSASVVIATYNRPGHVQECLTHLARQTVTPVETVVVDASPDRSTAEVVTDFPGVLYARNELGRGHTATSRAIGMMLTTGDVVAFVDDDAYAEPTWLAELLKRYEPGVGAVGGRARNGIPGEEDEGLDEIGRFLDTGVLTGNFAADPGHDVDVDHLLGANMSVLRNVVEELGGLHDHYPGTCLREETDIALRMRQAGYRIVYTPAAVVRHVAGAYARGRRFDTRYKYYGARNHMVLLAHNLGFRDPRTRNNVRLVARSAMRDLTRVVTAFQDPQKPDFRSRVKAAGGGVIRAAVHTGGTLVGAAVAARLAVFGDPEETRNHAETGVA